MLPGNAGAQVPGRSGLDIHTQRLHLAQRLFHHLLLQGTTNINVILTNLCPLILPLPLVLQWVAKLVARLLATAALWVLIRDGKCSERRWAYTPNPHQPGLISIMMECTTESGRCHSVCTLSSRYTKNKYINSSFFLSVTKLPLCPVSLVYFVSTSL
jgi:hypothetical protein